GSAFAPGSAAPARDTSRPAPPAAYRFPHPPLRMLFRRVPALAPVLGTLLRNARCDTAPDRAGKPAEPPASDRDAVAPFQSAALPPPRLLLPRNSPGLSTRRPPRPGSLCT